MRSFSAANRMASLFVQLYVLLPHPTRSCFARQYLTKVSSSLGWDDRDGQISTVFPAALPSLFIAQYNTIRTPSLCQYQELAAASPYVLIEKIKSEETDENGDEKEQGSEIHRALKTCDAPILNGNSWRGWQMFWARCTSLAIMHDGGRHISLISAAYKRLDSRQRYFFSSIRRR